MTDEVYKGVAQEAGNLIQNALEKLTAANNVATTREAPQGSRLFFDSGVELIYLQFNVGTNISLTVAIAGEKAKYPLDGHSSPNSANSLLFGGERAQYLDRDNDCGATVQFIDARQQSQSDNWSLSFKVVAGAGLHTLSNGHFEYTFTYLDAENVPHNNTRQSPGWTPSDGHSTTVVDIINLPGAVSIDPSSVKILKITSGGCASRR